MHKLHVESTKPYCIDGKWLMWRNYCSIMCRNIPCTVSLNYFSHFLSSLLLPFIITFLLLSLPFIITTFFHHYFSISLIGHIYLCKYIVPHGFCLLQQEIIISSMCSLILYFVYCNKKNNHFQ
jgi:hypothetical protein